VFYSVIGTAAAQSLLRIYYGIRIPTSTKDFSVLKKFRLLCGPLILLFKGHQRLFTGTESGWNVRMTTHLHIVPRLRMSGAVPPYLHYP